MPTATEKKKWSIWENQINKPYNIEWNFSLRIAFRGTEVNVNVSKIQQFSEKP